MMRNLILAILVLGLGLVGLQAQASANLLTDPGFDTQAVAEINWGTTPWWGGGGGGVSSGGGGWVTAAQSQSPSHSATLFTYGGDWAYAMAAQTLTSGIVGGNQYAVSAYFKRTADIGTATANFKVEWLNLVGTTIGTSVSTAKFDNTYGANSWNLISDNLTATSGAVGAKYEIIYNKAAGAAVGDIFIDDTNIDVVPEPTSMILLGTGILGLFGISRKKRS
ncbi:MAG: PEP-CTERM sorting domain-containing protein [Candidatus Omnitrophota bacterium]|nr:PEP-CTERM sorting domain-containing protein [Candidatus Omnitrophota bacterium]